MSTLDRRSFLGITAGGLGAFTLGGHRVVQAADEPPPLREYTGPNVVIIRFGGGVRRRETIDSQHTYAPFFLHELAKRGTLYTNMEISDLQGVQTSHGQGTLYILTGKYNAFTNVSNHILGERFESHVPTLFEYLRKTYDIPDYQALIINNEDRTDEEFYSFSNHHLFGVEFRSNVLSLHQFKLFLLREQLKHDRMSEKLRREKQKELNKREAIDHRANAPEMSPEIREFWDGWRGFYGDSGFVNPRGDRLLTELTARALKELRPKLVMINYTDPDYVHWGNPSHYTRGISIIDQGIRRLVEVVEADEEYRDNTVFVIVPDCGRDSNRLMSVPFQHHFDAHEIFALVVGPGIAKGVVVPRIVDQSSIAATIGELMDMPTEHVEGPVLEEAFA